MNVLGIDVGGTGIKGAIIDTIEGKMVSEKIKYATPNPKDPKAMFPVIQHICRDFGWQEGVGIGFPAVIDKGVSRTATNIHKDWIDYDVASELTKYLDVPVTVINDADAAGLAEMKFGAGRGRMGTVLMLTFGTGIGSALFDDGRLIPNIELGHIEFKGKMAEKKVSNHARKTRDLSWKEWGSELNEFLRHVYQLVNPQQIIFGGGVSKNFDEYSKYFDVQCPVVAAHLLNGAGIVGAALHYALLMED